MINEVDGSNNLIQFPIQLKKEWGSGDVKAERYFFQETTIRGIFDDDQ